MSAWLFILSIKPQTPLPANHILVIPQIGLKEKEYINTRQKQVNEIICSIIP